MRNTHGYGNFSHGLNQAEILRSGFTTMAGALQTLMVTLNESNVQLKRIADALSETDNEKIASGGEQ